MKRILMRIAVLCAAVFALSISAHADTASGSCGDGIDWALEGSTLTVSGNGPMENFEEEAPWAAYKSDITSLKIKGNVTTIGDNAFKDYDALTEVDFGSAMHTLGKHSFQGCDGLTSISLPGSFRIFDEECLRDCSRLTAIHCAGPFPSFKLNCLWGSAVKIYYPAKSPWPVSLVQQLEEAFHNRIEFLDSDGNDPYTPEEETTQATIEETTAPATEAATAPATAPTTVPTTAPTTAPTTEAVTEPTTQTTAFPYTIPETEAPTEAPKKGHSGVGFALIGFVLCAAGLGVLLFKPKGGKYSR